MADIHDRDRDGHNDGPCLRFFSKYFSHPCHQARCTGIRGVCEEVKSQDGCAVRGPGAQHDQANAQGTRGPDADLPAPVLPVREEVEDKVRDDLQRVAAERDDVDMVGVVAEALEVEHEVRVGAVRPGREGEGKEEEVRDRVDDYVPQLLLQHRGGNPHSGVDTGLAHAQLGQPLFRWSEPDGSGVGWGIRYRQEAEQALANGYGAGNNEKPLPSCQAMDTIHISIQSGLQCAQEHRSSDVRDIEECQAERELGRSVPVENEGHHARPKGGREEAQEEAKTVYRLSVGRLICEQDEEAPADFAQREEYRWPELVHSQLVFIQETP